MRVQFLLIKYDKTVKVWDLNYGNLMFTFQHTDLVVAVESLSDNLISSGSFDKTVKGK